MTNEQAQQLKQIRDQRHIWLGTGTAGQYIDFLLSLLPLVAFESHQIDGQTASSLINCGADTMRSRCIEKVKEMAEQWLGESRMASDAARSNAFYDRCNAARLIADELKTVTIQEQEKQQ